MTSSTTDGTSSNDAGITLMIDNYDSFTYNIVQYLAQLGANVVVRRNDEITVDQALALDPANIVISPGPGRPSEAGVSKAIIDAFAGRVPVLGVCLGHQSIIELYGGEIVRCGHIMHGKVSPVVHDNKGVYNGFIAATKHSDPRAFIEDDSGAFAPSETFLATRYHSLVGRPDTLPAALLVTSYVEEPVSASDPSAPLGKTIMGVRHRRYTVEGVQFHPESVTTQHGMKMLENFLRLRGGEWTSASITDGARA